MEKINRNELIKKYLEFFTSNKDYPHKEIPNASLIPQNDPSVLFTTAGMHPLVPFLLGQKHPHGNKLVGNQKCIRTGDIEEVGDTTHHTFFEMLGNWSLGDYWKKQAIKMSYDFLTKVLQIPKEKLAITCFAGDRKNNIPKDKESAEIWESVGISKKRIAFTKKDNWWGPAGKTGPCGPDTEIFYWKPKISSPPEKFNPEDEENWVEIWNNVLMQYNKDYQGNFQEAKQKNIDTGMGIERTVAVLNGLEDDYLTENFKPIIKKIEELSKTKYNSNENKENKKIMRVIADHIKASVMILSEE
ncbi:MAG TPA: alanine--tRNA ligase-related protein, partial [Candidatus Nanoarchaeia archaeon]|nr:alanine--tRNA ligase-related protein [Candidatus Nanoarchaeia archaeon]